MDIKRTKLMDSLFRDYKKKRPCTIRLSTADGAQYSVDNLASIENVEGCVVTVKLSSPADTSTKFIGCCMLIMDGMFSRSIYSGVIVNISDDGTCVMFTCPEAENLYITPGRSRSKVHCDAPQPPKQDQVKPQSVPSVSTGKKESHQ